MGCLHEMLVGETALCHRAPVVKRSARWGMRQLLWNPYPCSAPEHKPQEEVCHSFFSVLQAIFFLTGRNQQEPQADKPGVSLGTSLPFLVRFSIYSSACAARQPAVCCEQAAATSALPASVGLPLLACR